MEINELERTAPEWDALWQLFGAYLNQDLVEDYGDPWSAVAAYRAETGRSDLDAAAKAARRLAAEAHDDREASAALDKLGLDYSPQADGYSARGWLRELADFLESDP